MSPICEPKAADFGKHISQGSLFISKMEKTLNEKMFCSPMRIIFGWRGNEFNLSGVICVDSRPTVYLCVKLKASLQRKNGTNSDWFGIRG